MLILDSLERQVGIYTQAAALQRAMGADVEVPDWSEKRAEFDEWLMSQPPQYAPEELAIRQALGLTIGR